MEHQDIKVRAWHKLDKRMIYLGWGNGTFYSLSNIFGFGDTCDYQFSSGLQDKNMKDIYAGDIAKTTWESNDPADGLTEVKPVIFNEGGFYVGDYWLNEVNEFTEIIGNIDEHPELLNY